MKVVHPKGKVIEMPEEKGEKFLANPSKKKQGWRKKREVTEKQKANLKPKSKKVDKTTEKKKVDG